MKKIIIVGSSGSGKTHLAKIISERLKVPHIQLDALFWKPDWQESTDEELFAKIEQAIEVPSWVIDGNYSRTNHITWTKADTIIWVNLPLWLTFYQGLKRTIKRAITKEILWKENGNKESFKKILSTDSILLWIIKTHKSCKKKYPERITNSNYKHINFYRLKSRKQISTFLKQL